MKDLIEIIASSWSKRAGASPEEITQAEAALGRQLPEDYRTFLSWSNGGEGPIGDSYFSLWNTQEIKQLNEDYQIDRYLPQMIGIGTDGGGECYALDYRANPTATALVQCPLGDLDVASITVLGQTFREAIERALSA